MASSARRIVIEFLGDDKSASKVAGSVNRSTSKLGDTFKKVGKAAAFGLGAGLVIAAGGMVKATAAAIDDEASANKLATALKNATGATDKQIASVEDWITKQSLATGVADDELRPAFQRLAEATGDVTKAQDLLTLAQDVSAGTGKSLEAVSTALMKAQNGSISGLSRLGIKTKDAEGNTLSLQKATKKMADTFGGQAAAKAETMQGKMDRLKVMFNETMETIGYKLIPIVSKLADTLLKKGVPAIQQASKWAQDHLLPALKDLGDFIRDNVIPVARRIGEVLITVAGFMLKHKTAVVALTTAFLALVAITRIHAAVMAVQAAGGLLMMIKGLPIVTALTRTWAAVQWLMNAALSANPIGLVVVAIAALVAGLVIAYKKSETFRKIVDGAFRAVKRAAETAFNWVKDHWKMLLGIITTPVKAAVTAVVNGFNNMKAGISNALNAAKSLVGSIFGTIKSTISTKIGDIVSLVTGLPGKLLNKAGAFLSAGKELIGNIFEGLKDGAAGVGGLVADLMSAIKGAINSALHLPFTIHGPGPLPDFTIPAFAKGTVSTPSGLALVGEEGPELVEFPRGARVHSNSQTRGMARSVGGSGGGKVELHVHTLGGDPVAIAREMEKMLTRLQRANGGRALAFQV